jgi:hypothetical protein
MKLPSVSEYMAKLANNPQVAAEFAAATPGRSRLEAVTACHRLATATLAEIELNKSKLAVARAKIAALEAAKLSQSNLMKTPPSLTVKATPQATATAASFATQPLIMARSEFDKLNPQDKARFFKTGGKLI